MLMLMLRAIIDAIFDIIADYFRAMPLSAR